MRQFTMNVDDGLIKAAKVHAARTGRSIAEIVRELLAKEVGWTGDADAPPRVDERMAAAALTEFSAGRISRREAMARCGLSIDKYSEFVGLMRELEVAWPQQDPRRIDNEARIVAEAIKQARSGDAD